MFIAYKIACTRSFNRYTFNISNLVGICERVKCRSSWKKSKTFQLYETSLGFQILVVIQIKIKFKTISKLEDGC